VGHWGLEGRFGKEYVTPNGVGSKLWAEMFGVFFVTSPLYPLSTREGEMRDDWVFFKNILKGYEMRCAD